MERKVIQKKKLIDTPCKSTIKTIAEEYISSEYMQSRR